jgi:hypothetical protein
MTNSSSRLHIHDFKFEFLEILFVLLVGPLYYQYLFNIYDYWFSYTVELVNDRPEKGTLYLWARLLEELVWALPSKEDGQGDLLYE